MISYLFKILLYTKAKITINKAPVATGIITNSIVFAPKIAILGAKTIEFVIMPVATGALFIVIFAFVYNKILKR